MAITCSLVLCAFASLAGVDSSPIVLDGRFDDWIGREPTLIDPADAGRGMVDVGRVILTDDPHALHLFVELGRVVNLQRLPGRLVLVLDADGDASTGAEVQGLKGVDLEITFTPSNPKATDGIGSGVGVRVHSALGVEEISPYAIGLAFAPTAADDRAEIRVPRGGSSKYSKFLAGERCGGKFLVFDAKDALRDETEPFAHQFISSASKVDAAALEAPSDPLARGANVLRVVSWNVERAAMIKDPQRFARVLRALDPDVLLLQELTDKQSAEIVAAWLNEHVARLPSASSGLPPASAPAKPWSVAFGAGGGNLRTAVCSWRGLTPASGFEEITWRDGALSGGSQRDVRFAGALVAFENRPVLFGSIHLKCCGGATTDEDLVRIEEAQAIRSALNSRAKSIGAAGLALAGDYNLVGSFEPLELLVEGVDLDGSDLGVADAPQLDGRTHATWADPLQPFTPGRLDYFIYSDSTLTVRRSFVLDSADLGPRWLSVHGLEASDTAEASDHLPVVVELGWK